ncbi:hypothetical protein F3I62_14445 [Pseudomonas sp. R-28-1W-6]|jgi:hypothetical protein|uniref:hypothetical protein n=1 Tax=Pseudomonas sp. R-28-1W-6 TaxID=2650101 RepID=UPI001365F9DA|nr:hypothetical protein [Pseudomonas sp. R-28-1W-6]MWV13303.1 hypothetical protein [Pseudomonas sp. R-28-1W-6]
MPANIPAQPATPGAARAPLPLSKLLGQVVDCIWNCMRVDPAQLTYTGRQPLPLRGADK